MSTFNLRHFSSPEALRRVRLAHLLELLAPYRDYLIDRGIELDAEQFDLVRLAGVLMSPKASTLPQFLDDLYFVDEMATIEGIDALQDAIQKLPADQQALFEIDEDTAPADLAVQVRLRLPERLERKHAEQVIFSRRSFAYFKPRKGAQLERRTIGSDQIAALEVDLAATLESFRRGRRVTVFVFDREDGTWLLIRRGDPLTRDGAIQGEESTGVVYHPERYDVIHIDYDQGLIALNVVGDVKKLREAYSELLALHLCGERRLFVPTDQYTLEPLRQLDATSIACSDIEGFDAVTLKEIHLYWGGSEAETEIRSAQDLISAYARRGRKFPDSAKLVRATISMTFSDSRVSRSITIKTPDRLSYTRDSDAPLVQEWLLCRGFLISGGS